MARNVEYAFWAAKKCKIDIDKLGSFVYDPDNPIDLPLNYKNWYKIVDTSGNVIMAASYRDTTHTNEYYQFDIDVMGSLLDPECCTSNPPRELLCDSSEGMDVYCINVCTLDYDGNLLSDTIPDHIFDEAMSTLPTISILDEYLPIIAGVSLAAVAAYGIYQFTR